MSKSDRRYRNWHSAKAEQADAARQADARRRYRARLRKLVDVITATVQQKELDHYLLAHDEPMLLIVLKREVDRQPGGFMARHPYPWRTGHSDREQSERAMFMKEAYHLAIALGKVTRDTRSGDILLYAYNPPKYVLHRGDGQVIVDYIPTQDELTVRTTEPNVEPEFIHTDRILARIGPYL